VSMVHSLRKFVSYLLQQLAECWMLGALIDGLVQRACLSATGCKAAVVPMPALKEIAHGSNQVHFTHVSTPFPLGLQFNGSKVTFQMGK